MKKSFSISIQSIFMYIIVIGYLFPRGYNNINEVYHKACSMFMWISVLLTWIQWIKYMSISVLRGKGGKYTLQISGYFIIALLITAICRKDFSSGLQQLLAAPSVCVFMLLNLKRTPKKLLDTIINVLCIEFTINALMSISQPYINGMYHIVFLGHIQVVSQYTLFSILVGMLFWLVYHDKKKKLIYLFLITLYTVITTDADSALFTAIGLLIALLIYKWKLSRVLTLRSEYYVFLMIAFSVLIIYVSAINVNIFPDLYINGRRFVWQSALEKIKIHPIIGYGIDGVLLSTFWTSGFNYAHNQLIQNFMDGGLILTIAFVMMILGFVKRVNEIKMIKYKVLCNASLIALLFIMVFDSTTLYIYMYMILSVIFSVKTLILDPK